MNKVNFNEKAEELTLEMHTLGMDMDIEKQCAVYCAVLSVIEEALMDAYFDGTIEVTRNGS